MLSLACVALLAGPTALAFFAGGYFDEPRLWAGLAAWTLVLVAALASPGSPPRDRSALLAVGGLVSLGILTLVSTAWAPVSGAAWAAGQLILLYAGAMIAAMLLLRTPVVQRAVEPSLALGALIIISYGLAGRMLPGLVHLSRDGLAAGRLEQPLTYWNATGEVAAIGFVLTVRLAGDHSRAAWLRLAAAAASAPLGLGLYLSLSRGAMFACCAGLVALMVAAPARAQLQALALALSAGLLACLAAAPFGAVTSLIGTPTGREHQGAVVLAMLALVCGIAAFTQGRLARQEPAGDVRLPRHSVLIALGVVGLGLALAVVTGAKESSVAALGSGASRLARLDSDRYDYWRVALRAFEAQPLRGVGAGGWSVWWLKLRPFATGAQDAHSLPFQTAAELGVLGLTALTVMILGMVLVARRAHFLDPRLAAGPIAGCVVYLAHSPLDWDWQMPAVTLTATAMAGLLLALARRPEYSFDFYEPPPLRVSEPQAV